MSRINEDDEDLYTVTTTAKQIPIRWTAPEALEHLEYFMATDVWSFGILVWEVRGCVAWMRGCDWVCGCAWACGCVVQGGVDIVFGPGETITFVSYMQCCTYIC